MQSPIVLRQPHRLALILCGGAVEKACRTLRNRLEDFCRDLEQFTPHSRIEDWRTKWQEKWKEIVFQAWFQRVNLSAAELYKVSPL